MVRSKFRSHMRCELASGSSHDGHNDGFYKAIGINGMLQGRKFKKYGLHLSNAIQHLEDIFYTMEFVRLKSNVLIRNSFSICRRFIIRILLLPIVKRSSQKKEIYSI